MRKENSKPTLLLLCGLLSDEAVWVYQLEHLKEIAHVKILHFFEEDTSEKMVKTILTNAPAEFAIAGHSMGGWLALEVMRVAAKRITKLCLLNTTARDDSKEKCLRRKEMIQLVKEGQFQNLAEKITELFVYKPQIKKDVLDMLIRVGKEAFIHQQQAMIIREECMSILPKISCPTLVIHAQQDKNFSLEEHKEMTKKIPNAKLAIVEDSGHMSPMEQPQATTALLRFWMTYF